VRWSVGYFGVKDLFTVINLLGGVLGIYFAMHGRIDLAGYALFAGFLFGDALDGQVARLTKTGNRFGGEFDRATDHLAQGIVPAIVVYEGYALMGREVTGVVLMALLVTTASIRQARLSTVPFEFPHYCGLPRTVSGFVALSLPNCELFFRGQPWGPEIGIGVIGLMAILNLAPIPYMGHRGKRKMQGYVKIVALLFLTAPLLLFAFARVYLYDFIFACSFGYALTAWIPLLPEERRAFWAEYRRWSAEVASQK
jgi:phosphatidylserine synthase